MAYFLAIPLGILFGWLLSKIGSQKRTLSMLTFLFPYSILFWLTLDDRNFWGYYRIVTIFSSLIALLVWTAIEASHKNRKAS